MRKQVDLKTKIGKLVFKNPVTVASGTFGTKDEYKDFVDYSKLGAMITKTITVKPRVGNPMPRIYETAGGMLNAIGLQNKGLEDFIQNKIPYFKKLKTPLIVNIAGEKHGDFEELSRSLWKHKSVISALELNLSCPNVEAGGSNHMRKKKRISDAVKAVKESCGFPFFAKLSPELGDVLSIGELALKSGALGLSLINTLKGLAIDPETWAPRLANVTGGLSGPAIKPVALRYVYEARRELGAPIIASGGVTTAADAVEFLLAGASLVAMGTANFIHPSATMDVICGIEDYLARKKIKNISEIRSKFNPIKMTRKRS